MFTRKNLEASLDGLEIGATGHNRLQFVVRAGRSNVKVKLSAEEARWLASALEHRADELSAGFDGQYESQEWEDFPVDWKSKELWTVARISRELGNRTADKFEFDGIFVGSYNVALNTSLYLSICYDIIRFRPCTIPVDLHQVWERGVARLALSLWCGDSDGSDLAIVLTAP